MFLKYNQKKESWDRGQIRILHSALYFACSSPTPVAFYLAFKQLQKQLEN